MADQDLSQPSMQDSRMLTLPHEIILLVAELLPPRSWNALARTCRRFYTTFTPSLYSFAVEENRVFMWAAREGRLSTIRRIMSYAPKGYLDCVRGENALREAAWDGHKEIIRWLLDSGVDPCCTHTRMVHFYWLEWVEPPPVLIAAQNGQSETAKLLLDAMTDCDCAYFLREAPVVPFVEKKQTAFLESIPRPAMDVHQRDFRGRTVLFNAVRGKHMAGVMLLLECGADVNAADDDQITPLYLAAEMGLEAVVELLLQRGARVDMTNWAMETPLHVAVKANSIKTVALLIEHGANVNAIDREQKTAFQLSLRGWWRRTETGILKLLIDAGADFTAPDIHGVSPVELLLMDKDKEKVQLLLNAVEARGAASDLLDSCTTLLHAAIYAEHDLAHRLLAQGADVDKQERNRGLTPLMEAAKQEQDSLFDLVLQKSLDVNVADSWGRTALSFAAEHGSEHKVRSLLKKNASDFASTPWTKTPLAYAAKNHHLQVVLLLLKQTKGVDLTDNSLRSAVTSAVAFGDTQFLKLICEKGNPDQRNWFDKTELHYAAERGDLGVVKWLLTQSVSIDAATKDGQTPLMLAVCSRSDAVVEQLLQHGPRLDARDENPATPLHLASMGEIVRMVTLEPPHGPDPSLETANSDPMLKADREWGLLPVNSNIVKMLVEAGADLEAKNAMDETPLACAAINGSASAVRLLLEKGANVEPVDKSGFVPLQLAAWTGHTAVVSLLLEYGARIDFTNRHGDTALILAARNGQHETIPSLLASSAEINRVNHSHRTALSCAAEKGHDKVVEVLLQDGAEVDLPDHTGRTPLLWAVQNEHERCVELLVQGYADITRGDIEGRTSLWWASKRDKQGSQKSRDAIIRILYDRHPASSQLPSTKHARS